MDQGKVIGPGDGVTALKLNQCINIFGNNLTQIRTTNTDEYPDIEGPVLDPPDCNSGMEEIGNLQQMMLAAIPSSCIYNNDEDMELAQMVLAGCPTTLSKFEFNKKFLLESAIIVNKEKNKSFDIKEYADELCSLDEQKLKAEVRAEATRLAKKLKDMYTTEELQKRFDEYWYSSEFGNSWWDDAEKLEEASYMMALEIECMGGLNLIEEDKRGTQKAHEDYLKAKEENDYLETGEVVDDPMWSGDIAFEGRYIPNNRMILIQTLANASKNGYWDEDLHQKIEDSFVRTGSSIDFNEKNYTIDSDCIYALMESYEELPESNFKITSFLEKGGGAIIGGAMFLYIGWIGTVAVADEGLYVEEAEVVEENIYGETSENLIEGGTKSDILAQNRENGRAFEQQEFAKFSAENQNAVEQITVKTSSGVKTRVDAIGLDANGNVIINEYKSSLTAPLTENQKLAFSEIFESGATVVGKGKGIFSGGYQIPSGTKVTIIRPK